MRKQAPPTSAFAVYADASPGLSVMDVHQELNSKNLVMASSGVLDVASQSKRGIDKPIDFGMWLPAAAKEYVISKDVSDYILTPVLTIPSDIPNRNAVGFPLKELLRFSTSAGQLAYKTFTGKPVHIEHDNQNPKKAIGVIVDTVLLPLKSFGDGKIWGVVELLAIDRTKNPVIAQQILSGELNAYSMGAWSKSFTCSFCDAEMGKCNHLSQHKRNDFYILEGKLVYRLVCGMDGFETSVVFSPAYLTALSDKLMPY